MDSPLVRQPASLTAEAEALLKDLQREARHDLHWTTLYRATAMFSSLVAITLTFILVMGLMSGKQAFGNIASYCLLFGAVFFGAAGLAVGDLQHRRGRTKQRLIHRLRAENRATGPLLLLLHPEQSEEIVQIVEDLLKQMLPRLQAEDFSSLTPEHKEALFGALNSTDKEFVLAVLKTLERFGDKRALAPVATLLAQTDKIRVHKASQECLNEVLARVKQQEQADTLLRPSDANQTPPDLLLRPSVSDSAETPQGQLLRPIE